MLLVCVFSGLPIWYCKNNRHALHWGRPFLLLSSSPLCLAVLCLGWSPPHTSLLQVNWSTGLAIVQAMFWQLCGRDFIGVATLAFLGRHTVRANFLFLCLLQSFCLPLCNDLWALSSHQFIAIIIYLVGSVWKIYLWVYQILSRPHLPLPLFQLLHLPSLPSSPLPPYFTLLFSLFLAC